MNAAGWTILITSVASFVSAAAAWIRAEIANKRIKGHASWHGRQAAATSPPAGHRAGMP